MLVERGGILLSRRVYGGDMRLQRCREGLSYRAYYSGSFVSEARWLIAPCAAGISYIGEREADLDLKITTCRRAQLDFIISCLVNRCLEADLLHL